jgi:hypothetical protein
MRHAINFAFDAFGDDLPDSDQGTGAVGLLLDTATLKTMEAAEGRVYRWGGVRGWVVNDLESEVRQTMAAIAMAHPCTFPKDFVDLPHHSINHHVAPEDLDDESVAKALLWREQSTGSET